MILSLIFLIQTVLTAVITFQLRKIIMNNAELLQAMTALVDQLVKAFNEIVSEIQALDNVPQATVDKLTAAQAIAQQLDDLNPDTPAPNP